MAARHDFYELLMRALCCVLSGGQGALDMGLYVSAEEPFLRSFLKLSNGLPSHDTFSRLFRRLDDVLGLTAQIVSAQLQMLKPHLMAAYKMTPSQNRARWRLGPDDPVVPPDHARRRPSRAKRIGLATSDRTDQGKLRRGLRARIGQPGP